MRHYESLLLARETGSIEDQLEANSSVSLVLARVSQLLRMVARSMGGEDPEPALPMTEGGSHNGRGYSGPSDVTDWALERECELVRLEKENEELRRMVDVLYSTSQLPSASNLPRQSPIVRSCSRQPSSPAFPGPRRPSRRGGSMDGSEVGPRVDSTLL